MYVSEIELRDSCHSLLYQLVYRDFIDIRCEMGCYSVNVQVIRPTGSNDSDISKFKGGIDTWGLLSRKEISLGLENFVIHSVNKMFYWIRHFGHWDGN